MPLTGSTPASSSRPIQRGTANPRNLTPQQRSQEQQQQHRQQQAPWQSSLDLVWSYSRSQAFYGNNFATSPSFTDVRWRGPRRDSYGPDSLAEDDENEELASDEEDEHSPQGRPYGGSSASRDDDADLFPHATPVWSDEAFSASTSSGRRGHLSGARRTSGLASTPEESQGSSRNTSASPKRVGVSHDSQSGKASLAPEQGDPVGLGLSNSQTKTPVTAVADERTPLLQIDEARRVPRRMSRSSFSGMETPRRKVSGMSQRRMSGTAAPKGTSTFGQTLFNCINALVGIGILSLPLALSYASFSIGVPLFLGVGLLTSYTGRLLWKMMLLDPRLRTYADIGRFAFGDKAQIIIGLLFGAEMWAVSVALIIIFGDSLHALVHSAQLPAWIANLDELIGIRSWTLNQFKLLGFVIVLPTIFMPLRLLSPISVLGILSTVSLLSILIADGTIKKHAPGSLVEPAIAIWPPEEPQWKKFPLSFGLIMSGFSAHPVIPAFVRDMKEPNRFPSMLNISYVIATLIYLVMGVCGYLMYGKGVSDEITKNMAGIKEYPVALTRVAVWLIVIVPLTKFALSSRPLMGMLEGIFHVEEVLLNSSGVVLGRRDSQPKVDVITPPGASLPVDSKTPEHQTNGHTDPVEGFNAEGELPASTLEVPPLSATSSSTMRALSTSQHAPASSRNRTLLRHLLRFVTAISILLTAIVFPAFEKVMALLGASLAFSTCVIGPVSAHLKLFRHELSTTRILLDVCLLIVAFIAAVLGTVWAFLPSDR